MSYDPALCSIPRKNNTIRAHISSSASYLHEFLQIRFRAIAPHDITRHITSKVKNGKKRLMTTRLGNTLSLQIDQTRRPRSGGHDDPLCEVSSPVFCDHADTPAGEGVYERAGEGAGAVKEGMRRKIRVTSGKVI